MNHHSKIHKRLSERLENPRVLSNPEEFLGPNFEAVLNFWLFLDELTEEQLITINSRDWNFYNNQRSEWRKARDEAIKASEETIGEEFAYHAAASSVCDRATKELIGMHKLFEQNKPLTFFQMFLDL